MAENLGGEERGEELESEGEGEVLKGKEEEKASHVNYINNLPYT